MLSISFLLKIALLKSQSPREPHIVLMVYAIPCRYCSAVHGMLKNKLCNSFVPFVCILCCTAFAGVLLTFETTNITILVICRCSIISADYAHLELRIMAHFSQDQGLCRVLCDSNSDPFRMLAAQWQQCNQDEVKFFCCGFGKEWCLGRHVHSMLHGSIRHIVLCIFNKCGDLCFRHILHKRLAHHIQ